MRNVSFTGWKAVVVWFVGLWIVAAIVLAIAEAL